METNQINAIYQRETGRNGFSRGLEHISGLKKKRKKDNSLWKHCVLRHNSKLVKFRMVCLKSFKTALMRQINEGVRIACSRADICMNSKAEFYQPSIVRVTKNLGNPNEGDTMLLSDPL